MANVNVKIKVNADAKKVYVVGSTKNLGEWDAKKAVEVVDGTVTKQFAEGTTVEFKVLAGKTWNKVEKGAYDEELENRSFVASKGLIVEANVAKFNK